MKQLLVPFQLFGAIPRNEKAHHFNVRNRRRLQANQVGTALAICDDYISVFDVDVADFRRQAQLFAVSRRRQEPPHGALQRGLWNGQRPELPTRGLKTRSEEHTSELQSRLHLVCRLLLEKKKKTQHIAGHRLSSAA